MIRLQNVQPKDRDLLWNINQKYLYEMTNYYDDEHQYRLSYLTDVAVEWLGQAIHGLKTLEPFAVHGYCEPCRMICTVC